MIRKIFLPEKIGSRRILSQRIIGLSLHDDSVRLALVHAKHKTTVLEKLLLEKFQEGEQPHEEKVALAIKKIIAKIKSYDQIRICIPASIVVFKELQLQFSDPEKIRMVLDYEIESMLPFSIDEAIIDFIITKTQPDKSSQVLVAAVRNQDLETYLIPYKNADIDLTSITIDLFATYGLYQQIPEYHALPHATALVDFGLTTTRIAFIQDGQLRLTRYIQRGYGGITKAISDETQLPMQEIERLLTSSGIRGSGNDAFSKAAQKYFVLLLNDIQFTLNSFSLKLGFYEIISKVLFTGNSSSIYDFMPFCSDTIQIPCEQFDCKKLLENKHIKNKIKDTSTDWSSFAIALGTALPSQEQGLFDLCRKQFTFHHHGLLEKQIITASVIILVILATLGTKGYLDISALTNNAHTFEQREINRVKLEDIFSRDRFPKKPTLASIVRESEKVVHERLDMWAPFGKQRMRPLELWLALTDLLNKKQFDISIKEVVFTAEEKGWEKDKDGTIKKDSGIPKIEVEGFFHSKTGEHFASFGQLENVLKDSVSLKVIEPIDLTPADGGINFFVRMKQKDV